jgi:hypothetical protein
VLQSESSAEQVMREREDAAEFKARIEGLVLRYEAQHLPKRKRKLTTQQIRDMDEGALAVTCRCTCHQTCHCLWSSQASAAYMGPEQAQSSTLFW